MSSARRTSSITQSSLFLRLREFLRWFYRYRSIRLTGDGTRFFLLTFGIGIAAINTGNNLLYLLLAMMLSLIVMSGLLSEQCLKRLELRRRLPEQIHANRPVTAAFVITNRKERFPAFSLHLQDVADGVAIERGVRLLHLRPGASAHLRYPLLLTRRGRYRLEGVKLITQFPFGLFNKAATLPLVSDVVVYPEVQPLPPRLFQELTAWGQEQRVPRRGQGTALHNLRDYQAGDDSRAIHWRTSARQSRLIVKEHEAEDQRSVTIILPTARPMAALDQSEAESRFERAVVLAASLAEFFHRRGYRLRLIVGAHDVPAGIGGDQYLRVLNALALCQSGFQPSASSILLRSLSQDTAAGVLSVLVLPWEDPRLSALSRLVSRVFRVPATGGLYDSR